MPSCPSTARTWRQATCSSSAVRDTKISHTGLYLGEGKFINATTYQTPTVRIDELNDPHWDPIARGRKESAMNRRDFVKIAVAAAPVAATSSTGGRARHAADRQDRPSEAATHLDHDHVVQYLPRHRARDVYPRRDHGPRGRRTDRAVP